MTRSRLVGLTFLLLVSSRGPLHASGPVVHNLISLEATNHVENAALKELLIEMYPTYYGAGTLFPDSGLNQLQGMCHDSHSDDLLNAYLEKIKTRCGTNPDIGPDGDSECRELIAHFMGCLSHMVADHHFDRYFLTRVDAQCGFDDGGSGGCVLITPTTCSQGFTDRVLDGATWFLNFPCGCVPSAVVPGPYNQIFASCTSVPDSECVNIKKVLDEAYDDDFTHVQIQTWVSLHVALIHSLHQDADLDYILTIQTCPWALNNLVDNWGGIKDSGLVVAQYINKTWELLTSGATTQFRDHPIWGFPSETMSVGALFEDEWYDFSAWISLPEWDSDVDKFQLTEVTYTQLETPVLPVVATLRQGVLSLQYGEYFDKTVPVLVLADDVVDFEIEGSRIAILVDDGSPGPGHELRVKEVMTSIQVDPWVTVARRVVDFELEEDRVAVLQTNPGIARAGGGTAPPRSRLRVLDGALDSALVTAAGGRIADFHLEGERIAVLLNDGPVSDPGSLQTLYAKEGELTGGKWVTLFEAEPPIDKLLLEGDRIGFLRGDHLVIKEGALDAEWSDQGYGVYDFLLEKDWVGASFDDDAADIIVASKKNLEDDFDGETYSFMASPLIEFISPSPEPQDNIFVYVDVFNLMRVGKLGPAPVPNCPGVEPWQPDTGGIEALPSTGQITQIGIYAKPELPWTVHPNPNNQYSYGRPLRIGALVDGRLYVKGMNMIPPPLLPPCPEPCVP